MAPTTRPTTDKTDKADKADKADNRVQFRADPQMAAWLRSRATAAGADPSLHAAAQRELGAWRDALRVEQARTRWTATELACLADILNGALPSPGVGLVVAMDLGDAFGQEPGAYAGKWGIDEAGMLAKARAMSVTADTATTTAIAAWWDDPDRGEPLDPTTWRALGFRIDDTPTHDTTAVGIA